MNSGIKIQHKGKVHEHPKGPKFKVSHTGTHSLPMGKKKGSGAGDQRSKLKRATSLGAQLPKRYCRRRRRHRSEPYPAFPSPWGRLRRQKGNSSFFLSFPGREQQKRWEEVSCAESLIGSSFIRREEGKTLITEKSSSRGGAAIMRGSIYSGRKTNLASANFLYRRERHGFCLHLIAF